MQRALANLLVVFSVLILPLWVTGIIVFVLCFMFDFVEVIIYGYLLDVLFGAGGSFFATHAYVIGALVIYVMIHFIKPYLKL